MKKLIKGLIGLIGLVGLVGLNNASATDLSTYDLDYHWNFAEKKCAPTPFENKKIILFGVRNGEMIIDQMFENDPGKMKTIIFEYEGVEKELIMFNSFGMCRFYEDLVRKKMDVKAYQYVGLKTYNDKPKPLNPEDKK